MPIRGTASAVALSIALLAAGAVRAQGWQEYAYPDAGFSAVFPAPPTVSESRYQAGDVAGPAKVYRTRQGSADYSVTVVDLSSSRASGTAAIDAAVDAIAASGRIKADVRERIDRQFGRELSLAGRDGGQITTAVFYVDKKLYVLAGRTEPDASGQAIRFQQSLQFIDADGKPPRRPEDGPGLAGPGRAPPPNEFAAEAHGVLGEGPPDGGQARPRRRPPPQAFADCKDKAEGAAVRHQTPRGDIVPATCVATPEGLAARPDRPPPNQPPPEG